MSIWLISRVRQLQRAQARRYRKALWCSFGVGAVVGAAVLAIINTLPSFSTEAAMLPQSSLLSFVVENSTTLSLVFTAIVVIVSIWSALILQGTRMSHHDMTKIGNV